MVRPGDVLCVKSAAQILLELRETEIELLSEGDLKELVGHRPVEPLGEAIGVRGIDLGVPMSDLVDRQEELGGGGPY